MTFVPKGARPRWQILYDLVATKSVGQDIPYDEALSVLDPECTRVAAQQAMQRVMQELELAGLHTLETRYGFGWIVVNARQEIDIADRRARRAYRATGKAARGYQSAASKRDELSHADRAYADMRHSALRALAEIANRRKPSLKDFSALKQQLPPAP